ncbi:hypothetical protein SAMN03159343_1969 [Klenkia marina]|uniref:Tryptophan-associated transmembrane protein (Trp_oprn_chp) n=1 Tax=Klenkia marina TaxID=1960309 RepID=A0A1G4Y143_9ACTN|nr:hypothetical protein [Klenkia marina]SCX47251.1 hypothetical protein SAMN03159343_1969 [Klenkia marina]
MSQPDPDRTQVFTTPGSARTPDPADEQVTAVHPTASARDDADRQDTAVVPAVPPAGAAPAPEPVQTWRPPADPGATAPAWSTKPVAVRRPDPVGALLLQLAGVAAGLSLALPWTPGGATGYGLAEDVVDTAGRDWTDLFSTGLWQPGAVLAGGALLFVLGLLLLLPARAHRFLGALALVVAGVVVAAVLVPAAAQRWRPEAFDLGFAFALAVAGLGLLGALKALLTGPKLR